MSAGRAGDVSGTALVVVTEIDFGARSFSQEARASYRSNLHGFRATASASFGISPDSGC